MSERKTPEQVAYDLTAGEPFVQLTTFEREWAKNQIAAAIQDERDYALGQWSSVKAERDRLKELINLDRTGLAAGLNTARKAAKGRRWIAEREWGSYEYDQQTVETLQNEVAILLNEIEEVAVTALRESGQRADEAFHGTPMAAVAPASPFSVAHASAAPGPLNDKMAGVPTVPASPHNGPQSPHNYGGSPSPEPLH